MDSSERRMYPVAMTNINPRKEYWPSRGSNQRPPVLKSTPLPTELWGLALKCEDNNCNCFTHNKFLTFYSLTNDKILDWPKLKAFADDKLDVVKMIIFLLDKVENIVEKGENAVYQHFLLFQQFFQKASSYRLL